MVFVIVGMGGGIGIGVVLVVVGLVKEMGIFIVGVVIKFFVFEGKIRMKNVEGGIVEFKLKVDIFIMILNDRFL